jgi:hypothetical protein
VAAAHLLASERREPDEMALTEPTLRGSANPPTPPMPPAAPEIT